MTRDLLTDMKMVEGYRLTSGFNMLDDDEPKTVKKTHLTLFDNNFDETNKNKQALNRLREELFNRSK